MFVSPNSISTSVRIMAAQLTTTVLNIDSRRTGITRDGRDSLLRESSSSSDDIEIEV